MASVDIDLIEAPFTYRTLKEVARTQFVPEALRGNEAAILACILTGRELGLGPMESMRSIDVIDGRPSPSGEWMLSRVLEAGHLIYATEQTDRSCTVVGQRREDGVTVAETSFTFTIEMANRAGLTGKNNWKKYPEAMLFWRAVSQLARQLFPDVLHSIKYLGDELGSEAWHEPIPDTVDLPADIHDGDDDGEIVDAEIVQSADETPPPADTPAAPVPPAPVTHPDDQADTNLELERKIIQLKKDLIELVGDPKTAAKLWKQAEPPGGPQSEGSANATYQSALRAFRNDQAEPADDPTAPFDTGEQDTLV